MRVLAVLPHYPPGSLVGAWITTHEFLAHLAREGSHVDVVTYLGDSRATVDGVDVHPSGTNPVPLLRRADVVVSHLGDLDQASILARQWALPSVRMVHGLSAENRQRLEGTDTALAVFNSASLRDATGWSGPSIVCHPPVWPERYRTTPGECCTLVNTSFDKGGRVVQKIAASLPHVPFLAVEGSYDHQWIRSRAPSRGENIEIMPTQTDMRRVYRRTRVLLMPSRVETWGRTGVEAMTSGIPVIAHPTPGLVESLGDAGIYADRRDTAAWCREIERLHDPDEWATASRRALARANELHPAHDLERFSTALDALVSERPAA